MDSNTPRPRRPLFILDLFAIVTVVAVSIPLPAVMRSTIPADSIDTWDRRQYVVHLVSLFLIAWTLVFLFHLLISVGFKPSPRCFQFGYAGILAICLMLLLAAARQMFLGAMLPGYKYLARTHGTELLACDDS